MPASLASSVRMPPIQLLHQKSCKVWQRSKQGHPDVTLPRKSLQNARKPKRDPVTSCGRTEIAQRQQNDIALGECLPNGVRTNFPLRKFFLLQLPINPIALIRPEPFRGSRPIRQIKNRNHAKHHCGNSFQDEQPSPASEAEPSNAQQ